MKIETRSYNKKAEDRPFDGGKNSLFKLIIYWRPLKDN